MTTVGQTDAGGPRSQVTIHAEGSWGSFDPRKIRGVDYCKPKLEDLSMDMASSVCWQTHIVNWQIRFVVN